MSSEPYTVLEIGSGSFKLHRNDSFSVRYPSSLGKGLKGNKLDSESVETALASVENYILPFLKEHEVELAELKIFATAAIRRAQRDPVGSGKRFLEKLNGLGLPEVKIFTEVEECDYAAYAVIEDLKNDHEDFLILDTGGASHQLMEVKGLQVIKKKSFPIGSHSDLSRVALPNFAEEGYSRALPLVVIGTSGMIVNNIPRVNRNILREVFESIEGLDIEGRRDFLSLMIEDEATRILFVDYRLAILPNALRIILNCAENLFVPEFILTKKQAMDYISEHGFNKLQQEL